MVMVAPISCCHTPGSPNSEAAGSLPVCNLQNLFGPSQIASPDEVGAGKAGDVGADMLEGAVVGEDGDVGL